MLIFWDDCRAVRVSAFFIIIISSDYNARTFSFCQQIFSAITAAAAAAGGFFQPQHICVPKNAVRGCFLCDATLGCALCLFLIICLKDGIRFPRSPSDSLPSATWSQGHNLIDLTSSSYLAAHFTTCPQITNLFTLKIFVAHPFCAWHCFSFCFHKGLQPSEEKRSSRNKNIDNVCWTVPLCYSRSTPTLFHAASCPWRPTSVISLGLP